MKNIGEILKEARERRGFSRDVLADLISVSKETIARWERGERSPDARALKKIATALSVSISNLLGDFDLLSADTSEHKEQSALEKHAERKEAWDRAVNTTPPNPHHMAKVKVLPKEFRICCGKGVHWLDDTVEFESVINMPDPDLVRFSPLIAIWAEGDSMEPDIQDGDMVIFTDNIYERELAGNGDIVLVNYNGRLIIRGLMTRGEKMSLRAFNRDEYEDIEIDPQKDDFEVLGRVLKVHRTWKPRPVF